ncbi:MAG TPA: preprotein translocase subunit SecA [Gemmataceae bacterium]|jgi:preprotein translocase subunit SecA|nr:preprotein translocase subunit SecA [Gemmataceae bacterium]
MSTGVVSEPVAAPAAWPGVPARERLGPNWWNYLKMWFGWPSKRRLARAALQIDLIRHWEQEFGALSENELRMKATRLRGRARGGESLDKLLPEAFGMVCVASQRALGMRPFDVQLAGGVVLHHGAVAELATGEGKTLTAAAPVFLNALTGRGVHVTTVNDYLAKRDAEWMGPVYTMLGLSVGFLQQKMADVERKEMYRRDITHGTASEFGFDFLRDKLKIKSGQQPATNFWTPWLANGSSVDPMALDPRVQRGHYYAVVDEADSIFIDDARTPLIIGGATQLATKEECIVYIWSDRVARQMMPNDHFFLDEKKNKIELAEKGKQLMRWSNPPAGEHSHAMDKLQEHVERALWAHHRYRRDQHYMVHENKVVLIDEGTGRAQPDRHWRDGLHQAVETKEGVPITKATEHAAQITYQSYYRLYKKLAGMTGTCAQNWLEIFRVYRAWVVCVPTNKPCVREQWPDVVFSNESAKFDAVVQEVQRLHALGRPVLIGTRSVDKSEEVSRRLKAMGIDHDVLNARYHAQEAEIVKRAGVWGKVTVATNMAGRGTDIKPEQKVLEVGGLHVLGTERHDSMRIDRQLAGRAGRQGDVGSAQFFLSLEDELLEGLGEDKFESLKQTGRKGGDGDWQSYLPRFRTAQRRLERKHRRQRIDLMMWHRQREEILKELGADLHVD